MTADELSALMKARWADPIFHASRCGHPATEEQKRKVSAALKGRMPKNLALLNANKVGAGNPMWGR